MDIAMSFSRCASAGLVRCVLVYVPGLTRDLLRKKKLWDAKVGAAVLEMSRSRWHITRANGPLTLSRRLPVVFDLQVEAVLPRGSQIRVVHQIRQGLWRGLRGFAPVVQVTPRNARLKIIAGGEIVGRFVATALNARVADVLEDHRNRARWIAHA